VNSGTGRVTKRVPRFEIERTRKVFTRLDEQEYNVRLADMDAAPMGAVIGIWETSDWVCPIGTAFCSR
jgi:hypothetical protein